MDQTDPDKPPQQDMTVNAGDHGGLLSVSYGGPACGLDCAESRVGSTDSGLK